MGTLKTITPCLWFDDQAEAAVEMYTSVFKDSKVLQVARYGEAGFEQHQRPAGSIMTIDFELNGQTFTALNGGPVFKFSEAISLQVLCETQEEIDYYWSKLSQGGDERAQQCGWLKDRYGLSWQIVPTIMSTMMTDPNYEKKERAVAAMMDMKKLDIEKLKRAYADL